MKIAFTSCTRFESFPSQPEWKIIEEKNPDYLFLLGDNIYMDWGINLTFPKYYTPAYFRKVMRKKYYNQWNEPHFKSIVRKMRAKNGFFGTWDDHDFAWNDVRGTKVSLTKKNASRDLFHDFMNCSTNLPEVYYSIDTPLARVIFLDNRYHAEDPGNTSKLLGIEQFNFLKEKLNHTLPFTLICGGITITEGSDNWEKYPNELKELCSAISGKNNVAFLAGDIHKNVFIPSQTKNGNKLPLQLISSGFQIDFNGKGHNWCMLTIDNNKIAADFYQAGEVQYSISDIFKHNESFNQ